MKLHIVKLKSANLFDINLNIFRTKKDAEFYIKDCELDIDECEDQYEIVSFTEDT